MSYDGITQFGLQVHRRAQAVADPLDAGIPVNRGKTLDGSLRLISIIHMGQGFEISITARRNSDDLLLLVEGRTGPEVKFGELFPDVHTQIKPSF